MPPKGKPGSAGRGRPVEFSAQDYASIDETNAAMSVPDEAKQVAQKAFEPPGKALGHQKGRGKVHQKHGEGQLAPGEDAVPPQQNPV